MQNERKILGVDSCHNQSVKGNNVTVAVLDTGIHPHLDFVMGRNRIVEFWSMDRGVEQPYDDNGHGTAVSGILASNGLVSYGKYTGIAPQVNIVGVKVIDDNGIGDANSILQGMQYVYNNKDRLGIRVACMSFGSEPINPDPIMKGAELLWQQGVVVVASSGNGGPNSRTVRSPGATPDIITVGGVDFKEGVPYVTDFSSRGPWRYYNRPDIVAPAVNIRTTGHVQHYTTMTGTSMSAPIVAGTVALMLGVNPQLSPNKIKQVLLDTAIFVDNDRNASGWGMINVRQAISLVQVAV